MKKEDKIIHYETIAEQQDEAAGLSGPCSVCGKVHFIDEMRSLPEVEDHAREIGLAISRDLPLPKAPSDEDLMARYGFNHKAVFCEDCLKKVLARAFIKDVEDAAVKPST